MCGANKRTLTIIIFCIFSENDVYKYAGSCTIVNGHKCLAAHSRNNLLKYLQEITRYICASNFTEILQPNKGFVVSDNLYVFDHCFVKSGEDHWVCICGIHIHDLGLPDDDRTIFPLKCTYEDIKQPCKKLFRMASRTFCPRLKFYSKPWVGQSPKILAEMKKITKITKITKTLI